MPACLLVISLGNINNQGWQYGTVVHFTKYASVRYVSQLQLTL